MSHGFQWLTKVIINETLSTLIFGLLRAYPGCSIEIYWLKSKYLFIAISQYCVSKCLVWIRPKKSKLLEKAWTLVASRILHSVQKIGALCVRWGGVWRPTIFGTHGMMRVRIKMFAYRYLSFNWKCHGYINILIIFLCCIISHDFRRCFIKKPSHDFRSLQNL